MSFEPETPPRNKHPWTRTRVFMWIHLGYLLALPSLAMLAIGFLGVPDARWPRIFCFFPVFFYLYIMSLLYEIPDSLPHTTILAFSTPILVVVDTLLAGDTVWHFVLEDAAIEIGAFSLATAYAFVRYGTRDFGIGCLFAGAAFGAVSVVGLMGPILVERAREHPASLVLFAFCLVWSFMFYRPFHDEFQTPGRSKGTLCVRYESSLANYFFPNARPRGTIGPTLPEPVLFIFVFAAYIIAMIVGAFVPSG